jgi:hypothetical protein
MRVPSVSLFPFLPAAALLAAGAATAQPAAVLPRPSYADTLYLFFDAPGLAGDDDEFRADADAITSRLAGGPYARVGMSSFLTLDMDWNADPANPVLTSPSAPFLHSILSRARTRGFPVHLGMIAGISRDTWMYDAAKLEDRRNCQWYADGLLMAAGQSFSDDVWLTPSRYARKLRRHLEAKVRAYAREVLVERAGDPDSLVSSSGDGETELNYGRLDRGLTEDSQMIADYSPFAILEFRDWIRHDGLYAPGQPYDGQGFPAGGAIYQGGGGLEAFNAAYGTFFSSWNLAYYDWSLSDPIDGDPGAIPAAAYGDSSWTPFPTSGPGAVPGGFDAPRSAQKPSLAFWQLWLAFREAMVSHYVQDFAGWMTSTVGTGGETLDPARWYSHQIPADYLNDTFPGCPAPEPRLRTSASPMHTGLVGGAGSLGLTSFDVLDENGYHRTGHYLFPDVAALGLANWGLPEYSPSWASIPDPSVQPLVSHILEAYGAGAHILSYDPWPHFFTTPSPEAFSVVLSAVKGHPRNTEGTVFLPPQVSGVSAVWFNSTVAVSWSDRVFPDVPGFAWKDWSDFGHFEVWRGSASDFALADGQLVATSLTQSVAGILPDPSRPFYRVVAVNSAEQEGAPSDAVPTAAPAGAGFYTLSPCRLVDTRDPPGPLSGPPLAGSEVRVFGVTGACGIPAGARSISANVTVAGAAAPGFLRAYPADELPTAASTINFAAGAVRANNAVLALSATGQLAIGNGSTGQVQVLVDVNGYFQ